VLVKLVDDAHIQVTTPSGTLIVAHPRVPPEAPPRTVTTGSDTSLNGASSPVVAVRDLREYDCVLEDVWM